MKKIITFVLLTAVMQQAIGQTETFDIATYTPPKDFKKASKQGVVIYTNVNATTGSFCMIAIYASTTSAGNEQKDFANEWKNLVVTPYKAAANPKTETQTNYDGWKAVTSAAAFKEDSIDSYVILTVFSGFGKTTSILVNLNDQAYLPLIDSLLGNIKLDKTVATINPNPGIENNHSMVKPGLTNSATEKFGHLIYKPIDGWKQTNYTNAVSFSPADILPGYALETRIMESKSFSGSLKQALEESWNDALQQLQAHSVINSYSILAEKKSPNGWEYIRGEGIIADNGNNEFYINLFVVKLNNRIERIFAVSQRIVRMYHDPASAWENYSSVVDDFFYSVKFDDWKGSDFQKGDLNASGIVGVYGKRELRQYVEAGITKMRESGAYYIFFSNGQLYQFGGFPRDGLEGLNTWAAAVQDTFHWSTYSFQNGKGAYKIHGIVYSLKMIGTGVDIRREPVSAGTKYPYPKIPSVDGAVFNGTYIIESIYHDDKLDGNIIFTADGKFIDKGPLNILNHRQTDSYNITEKPGSGTYEVKNYTVIFKYSDGRILHIAFPGINYDKKNQSPEKIMMSFKEDVLIKK